MRYLVFGGSWFFGRLILEDLVNRGFDVTVFNKGRTLPPSDNIRHIIGDRECDDHLRKLTQSGPWDVVIDISGKIPAVVRRSVRTMAGVTDRYVFVSTVQAYRDWPLIPVSEDSPLRLCDPEYDPGTRIWSAKDYGQLKAGCELACREAFDNDRLLILRLQTMIGQYEYAGPLQSLMRRLYRGSPVIVPTPDRMIQAIDVRDVANFLVEQAQLGAHGVFNVGVPIDSRSYNSIVQFCAEAVSPDMNTKPILVRINGNWLVEQGVQQLTELPLWSEAIAQWDVKIDRAKKAGLRCRPLSNTILDTWKWLKNSGWAADHKRFIMYGMNPVRERAIIDHWNEKKTY